MLSGRSGPPIGGRQYGLRPSFACVDLFRDIDLLLQGVLDQQGRPRKPSPGWGRWHAEGVTDEVVCLARVCRIESDDRVSSAGEGVHRWGRRPNPAALPPPSGAAARPLLKTVHRTIFRALRARGAGKCDGSGSGSPLLTAVSPRCNAGERRGKGGRWRHRPGRRSLRSSHCRLRRRGCRSLLPGKSPREAGSPAGAPL